LTTEIDTKHRQTQGKNSEEDVDENSWTCPVCKKKAEGAVIEFSRCLNWLHYKCEKMKKIEFRRHIDNNSLDYTCKSCQSLDNMDMMKDMMGLSTKNDEVEDSIDTSSTTPNAS